MSLLIKRKKPESKPTAGLIESDRTLLNIIKSKKEMAIWFRDLQKEATNLSDQIIKKSLKNLKNLSLIKEVAHVHLKGRQYYIAAEFEPSKEITGGSWYVNGNLDIAFIDQLKNICVKIISNLKVATANGVYDYIKAKSLTNDNCTSQQINEILRSMVLDNLVIEVKSTGLGEYHSIPVGEICYRCPAGDFGQRLKTGAMVSCPCGVCPRITECTPDGLISPSTCEYFVKWLEF